MTTDEREVRLTVEERFVAAKAKITNEMRRDQQVELIVDTLCHQNIRDFSLWMQSKDQCLDRYVFPLSTGREAKCAIIRLDKSDPPSVMIDIQEVGDAERVNTAAGRKLVLSGPITQDESVEIAKTLSRLFKTVFEISGGGEAWCAGKLVGSTLRMEAPRFPVGTNLQRGKVLAVVGALPYEGPLQGVAARYIARHLKKNGQPGKRVERVGREWSRVEE